MAGHQFNSTYKQDQLHQEKEARLKQDEVDNYKQALDTKKVEDSKPKKPVGMFSKELS